MIIYDKPLQNGQPPFKRGHLPVPKRWLLNDGSAIIIDNSIQKVCQSDSEKTVGIVKHLKTINRFRLFRGGLKSAAPLCVGFMLHLQNLIVKSPFESLHIHAPEFFNK